MKKSIRRIALILVCAIIACGSISCTTPDADDNGDKHYNGIGEDDGTRATTPDNLPELDYDGATITVFHRNGLELYEGAGEAGSDLVYNAVYERNERVAARLNIKFEWIPSTTGALGETANEIVNILSTYNDEYDYILTTNNTLLSAGMNAYMWDFNSAYYVELTQPWWWSNCIEEMAFDGKTYNFLVGEMNLTNFHKMSAFYFNCNLLESTLRLTPADMYAKVDNGTWTIDEMSRLVSKCYIDLDGDDTASDRDLYGMPVCDSATVYQLAMSTDIDVYRRLPNGSVKLLINNQRMVDLCQKLTDLTHDNQGVVRISGDTGYDGSTITDFTQRKYVFLAQRFTAACHDDMRNMTDDYGIIPYPTLTEGDEYVSFIQSSSTCVSAPYCIGEERFDRTCAVLEATAAESYRTVTEKFYEYALKSKYVRDDSDSPRMIDLIYNTSRKYFVDEYNNEAGKIMHTIITSVRNDVNFSTLYASSGEAAEISLNLFIKKCQAAY